MARRKAKLIGGKTRKIGGIRFTRKVGTRTKNSASLSAGISRRAGKLARVVQVKPGRWVVYTRSTKGRRK